MRITSIVGSTQVLILAGLCGAMSAFGQTSTVPPANSFAPGVANNLQQKLEAMTPEERQKFLDSHPRIRARFEEGRIMLGKYAEMSPSEKAQFLQTHAGLQKFIQSHPQAVARAEANASEAKPGVVDLGHPRVNEVNRREENQQQRIAQGDATGTLTPGQTAKIEGQEQKIQSQEAADMNKDNGHLTKTDQRQLNHEENHVGNEIADDKHGAEAKPGVVDPGHPRVNEVNRREENQQQRIAQGEAHGTLSSGEAAKIEGQEKKIQSQEAADMNKDHGHLTKPDQRALNREENHESRRIFKDKEKGREKKVKEKKKKKE